MGTISTMFSLIIIILLYMAVSLVRTASDNERFAEFALGSFRGLKSPGLLIKMPGGAITWHRIRIGDQGELIAHGLARFNKIELPVTTPDDIVPGALVRITGFGESSATVMLNPDQRKTIRCENCGHEMSI